MVVMAGGCTVTDRILIRHGDQWLALSTDAYREALQRGNQLMPSLHITSAETECDKSVWFKVAQVAERCNVSETHLRDEIALGNIKTRHFGRAVRIHRSFVERQTGDLMSNDGSDK